MNRYLLIGATAAIALAGLQGYRMGYAASEGRHAAALVAAQREAFAAAEAASRKEAERLAMEAERDALARDLEAQAYTDPDRDRPALSADGVRRLNVR